jgi:hypothetical protein
METIDIICFIGGLGSFISCIVVIYCKMKVYNLNKNKTKIIPSGIIIPNKVIVVPENNINRDDPIATMFVN